MSVWTLILSLVFILSVSGQPRWKPFWDPSEHPFIANVTETVPDYWVKGTGLAITLSCNLESGGQPEVGSDPASPAMASLRETLPWPPNQRDFLTDTWYEYGIHEGIPRLLDLWDEFGIKVSSYMVGKAAERSPELAKNIVDRGHEPVNHGREWASQILMDIEEETEFIKAGADMIEAATGQRPKGFNAYWMLDSNNTLGILQKLNHTYHVDDLSRDIPFTKIVNGVPFALVPYTLRLNDLNLFQTYWYSFEDFFEQLYNEFEQLYRESKTKRRLLSISSHDRVGGTPGFVNIYRRFLAYVGSHEDVWFVRKDWMANWALENGPHYSCKANSFVCEDSTCYGDNCPSWPETPPWY